MKNLIVASLSVLLLITLFRCKQTIPDVVCKSTYFASANVEIMIDTHRDLVTQTNTVTCPYDNRATETDPDSFAYGDRHCTFSAMPNKGCIRGGTRPDEQGYVTFSTHYWYKHNVAVQTKPFHVQWMSESDLLPLFGTCVRCKPNPVVLPAVLRDNSFQVFFVPVDAYKASGLTQSMIPALSGYARTTTDPLLQLALSGADIQRINEVSVECDGGHMSKILPAAYNNVKSSVGVLCEVVLTNGLKMDCYVFNNEDTHNLIWKEKK
jgi:hypothetical protein